MSFERAKYEFPIDGVERHQKAGAPAGIYLLDGCWHLAAHESAAELQLVERGALLVATLTFTAAVRPQNVVPISALACLQLAQTSAC